MTSEDSYALITEDYLNKTIFARTVGHNCEALMGRVIHELEKINNSYSNLDWDQYIPCNCIVCVESSTPYYYPLRDLSRFSRDNKDLIQCRESYEMISVRGLFHSEIDIRELTISDPPPGEPKYANQIGTLVLQQAADASFVISEGIMKNRTINIGEGAIVSAPVFIADSIENSFNVIENSPLDQHLKQLITALLIAIKDLGQNAQEDQVSTVEGMARDAETLAREAASTSPRKELFKVTLDGMKKAAKSLGEIGIPVIKLAVKLYSILVH